MNILESIKLFLSNIGHSFISEVMDAIPQVEQIILQGLTIVVDAAVAYVESKYLDQMNGVKSSEPLNPEKKLALDNSRHNDAFNYVKEKIAENPDVYIGVTDVHIHFHVELSVLKVKNLSKGNHGILPEGNSSGS